MMLVCMTGLLISFFIALGGFSPDTTALHSGLWGAAGSFHGDALFPALKLVTPVIVKG